MAELRKEILRKRLAELRTAPVVNKTIKRTKRLMKSELDQLGNSIIDMNINLPDETLVRHYVSVPQFLSILEGNHL